MENKWQYYNHALVPSIAPHHSFNPTDAEVELELKKSKKALLARWTTSFDCEETDFWYCIKDNPFSLEDAKKDIKYKIRKGIKYFNVIRCFPLDYAEELYYVFMEAQRSYPKKNRTNLSKEQFVNYLRNLQYDASIIFYIAFLKETNEVAGYVVMKECEDYCQLQSQKALPSLQKYQVNAAMVYYVVSDYNSKLESGDFYINDGARNINHETHFQDYLEKYFGFRKAYCRLNVKFKRRIKIIILMLYPLKKILLKLDRIRIIHLINGCIKMEQIARKARGK